MLNFNMRNPRTIEETITHITPKIHGDMICLQLECGNSTGHLVPLCLSFLYNVVDFRPVNLIGYCAIDNQDGLIHLKGKEIAESRWLILSTFTLRHRFISSLSSFYMHVTNGKGHGAELVVNAPFLQKPTRFVIGQRSN